MNLLSSGPIATGAAEAAHRVLRHRRIIIPAAALAFAALVAPAVYFTGSAEEPARQVAAAAGLGKVQSAQEKVATSLTVEALPAAPTTAKTIAAELETAEERAPRVARMPAEPAPAQVQAEKVAVLSDSDPRWAGGSATVEPVEAAELRSQLEELKRPAGAVPAADLAKATVPAEAAGADSDVTSTGAIAAAAFTAPEPVARPSEREAQIIAPAATQDAKQMAAVPAKVQDAAAAKAAAPANVRAARINTYVNMRSGPQNEASVLTVVPSGAEVGVIGGCKHWCQVTYGGHRGYVYKSFISGS